MKQISLELKFNIDNLDGYAPGLENCASTHHAHLLIDSRKEITLKVFFDERTSLDDKIASFISNEKRLNAFAKKLEVVNVNEPDRVLSVDFSNSSLHSINSFIGFYEGKEKYFLIGFLQIRVVYKPVETNIKEDEWNTSEFYLNDAAKKFIREFYTYFGFYKKNTWEAISQHKNFHNYNEIQFNLDNQFYSKNDKVAYTSTIFSEPRLKIRNRNLDENRLLKYGNFIGALLSFYWLTNIEFFFVRLHKKEYTSTISIISKNTFKEGSHWIQYLGFRGNVFDFIEQTSTGAFERSNFIIKIIKHYILALDMEGESKFMILYNILEQIRNEYLSSDKIEQEYKFTLPKEKTNKFIRDRLRLISEIVDPDQKELFNSKVIGHVDTIKFLPMDNQFVNLFKYFDINISKYDIDFGELKKLRNKVFHGIPIPNNSPQLIIANKRLPGLVGSLFLAMFGFKL